MIPIKAIYKIVHRIKKQHIIEKQIIKQQIMKKQQYIAPHMTCIKIKVESHLMAGSLGTAGNTGIIMGETGSTPTKGDSRDDYSVWDDDEDND